MSYTEVMRLKREEVLEAGDYRCNNCGTKDDQDPQRKYPHLIIYENKLWCKKCFGYLWPHAQGGKWWYVAQEAKNLSLDGETLPRGAKTIIARKLGITRERVRQLLNKGDWRK